MKITGHPKRSRRALDGLGLARAHLAGTSYGGFLALTLAAREPGRARSLTLVEPGADCHRIRLELEQMLEERFGLEHTTLQVEHVGTASGLEIKRSTA